MSPAPPTEPSSSRPRGQARSPWPERTERAHAMQRAASGRKVSREQAEVHQQIEMIFHKGFWTEFEAADIHRRNVEVLVRA